jgi:hypothetical protein
LGKNVVWHIKLQSFYPAKFDREMGCTQAEWLMWLPAAMGDVRWTQGAAALQATLGQGHLHLHWRVGEPRRIALIAMPRLHVTFAFDGLDDAQRYTFMKRFDLYMHRGGG